MLTRAGVRNAVFADAERGRSVPRSVARPLAAAMILIAGAAMPGGCACDRCEPETLLVAGEADSAVLETNRRVKALSGRAWALHELAETIAARRASPAGAAWDDLAQRIRTFLYGTVLAWSDAWDEILAGRASVRVPGESSPVAGVEDFARVFDRAAPALNAEYRQLMTELATQAAAP